MEVVLEDSLEVWLNIFCIQVSRTLSEVIYSECFDLRFRGARLINGAKISSGKRGEALEEENGDDYYIVSRLVLPYDVENRIIRVPRSG